MLKTEREIRHEKQLALNAEAKARGAAWRAKDPRKNVIDPWDALKKPAPEFPAVVPPLPANPNAPGAGGRGGQAADPWGPKLDAIRQSVDALRGDLTGGAA